MQIKLINYLKKEGDMKMKKKCINIIIAFVVALIMSVNVAEAADCLGGDVFVCMLEWQMLLEHIQFLMRV